MVFKAPVATSDSAETIALMALSYVAERDTVMKQMVVQTGIAPVTLHRRASDPELLAGVLDFLLSSETLLLDFCEAKKLSPDVIARVRQKLPGAITDW